MLVSVRLSDPVSNLRGSTSPSFSRLPVLPEANPTHTAGHLGSDRLSEELKALSTAEERSSAVEGPGDGGAF